MKSIHHDLNRENPSISLGVSIYLRLFLEKVKPEILGVAHALIGTG